MEKWKTGHYIGRAGNYLDWIGPVIFSSPPEELPFKVEIVRETHFPGYASTGAERQLSADPGVRREVKRRLTWKYPYKTGTLTPAKLSVTEIRRLLEEQEYEWPGISTGKSMSGQESGAGSRVHSSVWESTLCLLKCHLKRPSMERIQEELARLASMGLPRLNT